MKQGEATIKDLIANLKELIKKNSPLIRSWIQIVLFFVIWILFCKLIEVV